MLICSRFSLGLMLAVGALALTAFAQAQEPDSGIYGTMVAAWGNPPANPPTYKCVRVFDSSGQSLVATGTCSGMYGEFRIPLAPGRYLVDKRPVVDARTSTLAPGTRSLAVEVRHGQWLRLEPSAPPGPVP